MTPAFREASRLSFISNELHKIYNVAKLGDITSDWSQ